MADAERPTSIFTDAGEAWLQNLQDEMITRQEKQRLEDIFPRQLEAARPYMERAYEVACEIITEPLVEAVAERIASVRRPSGTVSDLLGPEVGRIMSELDSDRRHTHVTHNFRDTGNPAIVVEALGGTKSEIEQFIVAQGDEISFGIDEAGKTEAKLVALCAHRQDPRPLGLQRGAFPAEAYVLRESDLGIAYMEMLGDGQVITDEKRNVFFTLDDPTGSMATLDQPGVRIVFNPTPGDPRRLRRSKLNSDILEGMVDNSIGVAAAILAARTIDEIQKRYPNEYRDVGVTVVTDDNEEGNPDGMFGGGAQRLAEVNQTGKYDFGRRRKAKYIVIDGHDSPDENSIPQAALVSDVVSAGKSFVLSPKRAIRHEQIAAIVRQQGGRVDWDRTHRVKTSRSSEWGLKYAGVPDEDMAVIGYGEFRPHHHDFQAARASLKGTTETSRLLVPAIVAGSKGLL